jgi:hypothetical protein
MPALDGRTLCAAFAVFRPHLTRRTFVKFVLVAVAWLAIAGRHTLAAGLVALGLTDVRDWTAFYRLFNRGRWRPDVLGRALLDAWVARLGDAVLTFVVDDTLLPHPGPCVWGAGRHRDAIRSAKRGRVFARGHRWVVLALVVRVPFARRPWALPVLCRLYRTRATCAATGSAPVKVTVVARALITTLAAWLPGRRLRVVGDSAFTNGTVMRDLPPHVTFVGALRDDAVLTAAPPPRPAHARGRRRTQGARLPTPAALVAAAAYPWRHVTAVLYGRVARPAYKVLQAQWYKACGPAELRVVVVRALCARRAWRAFVSTDPALDVAALLETFAARWSIETFLRDAKQHLGWAQPQVRAHAAVLRVVPFIALVYGALVLWAVRHGVTADAAGVRATRPWYRHKDVLTVEDLVRLARRAAGDRRIFREASDLRDLPETTPTPRPHDGCTIPMAT